VRITTKSLGGACRVKRGATIAALAVAGFAWTSMGTAQADPLLDEMVEFTGQIFFIESKVPAVVIGAVRNGEVSVRGFGERSGPGSAPPDGDTLLRLGSITKAFTGEMLAHLTADNTVQLTQPLTQWVPELAAGANGDVQGIRLINLATHSAGLPREVPHEPGPDNDPFAPITRDAFATWLKKEPLLFAPGSSVLYSNFGFDLLSLALSSAAKKPYPELLDEHITGPLNMKDTVFALSDEQKKRLMQGHDPDGKALPDVPTGSIIVGSGGLYSTPNDLLRWMQWHLDRLGQKDAEARVLDHALYLMRDGLHTASGMDESGHMDAMGLAWVGMMAKDDRPFILQKAGGLQGTFSYIAFAPTRGVAVFIAINKFDFSAATNMAVFANELLETLAPR
jgi:D-alanyl-D-alanine-carboxypeptidase/D-alanyl-D-alanine-endopeptidase